LNIGAQLQTFLYAKNRQTEQKDHTVSSTADARPTIHTILGMAIDEVRVIFALILFWSDQ